MIKWSLKWNLRIGHFVIFADKSLVIVMQSRWLAMQCTLLWEKIAHIESGIQWGVMAQEWRNKQQVVTACDVIIALRQTDSSYIIAR
jgi:hypothetical protein